MVKKKRDANLQQEEKELLVELVATKYRNITECKATDVVSVKINKKAQLTLSNRRDVKACQNCSNSTCFVSFHQIPFPQIANL